MSWYIQCGRDGDEVLSSRVRHARNLEGYSFPHRMTNDKMIDLRDRAVECLHSLPSADTDKFVSLNMDLLPEPDRLALVEKHLISDALAKGGSGQSVCISKDESVSIMENEEDHLRVQVMNCGFSLDQAYRMAEEIAIFLEKYLPIAYSDQ